MSELLEERVAEFIELREAGRAVSAQDFAAGYPEMEALLLESLARLRVTENLFPEADITPEEIGPWIVQREIGRGGMGRVLLVHRRGDPARRPFALKVLNPQLTFHGRSISRIKREGEILQRLDHPGLVRVEEVNGDPGGPWIAMEYVEGRALSEVLAEARAHGADAPLAFVAAPSAEAQAAEAWQRLAAFGAQIAEAAAEAHAAGLVHRDIKPSNVIVRADGTPVLIDFGLAASDSSATLTRTGDLLGTPLYMAPEQARGERADVRTDVWSLGATLYECATLRSPLPVSEPLAVIAWLRRHRPERLTGHASVPMGPAKAIDRALSFRSRRRFTSMQQFADSLRRAAAGDQSESRSRGTWTLERVEDRLRAAPKFLAVGIAGALLLAVGWSIASIATEGQRGAKSNVEASASSVAYDWLRAGTLAYLARDRSDWAHCADEAEKAAPPGSDAAQRAGILRGVGDPDRLPVAFDDPDLERLAAGIRAYREGQHEAAITSFRVAVQRAGDWMLPLVLLGEAARDAENLELCEREWTSAIRVLSSSPHLFRRLGKVRRKRGDIEGAIDALRRADEIDPEDWRNAAELARVLISSSRPNARREALAAVDRAVERCDSPSPSLMNVKAAIIDTEDRREDARRIYREILSDEPEHFWSHFNLGYSFSLDCKLSDARLAYEEAVRLRPESVEAQFALAHLAVGAEAPTCTHCQSAIDRDESLVDPDRAVQHLVLALRAGAREVDWLPNAAAELAIRMERAQEVGDVLEEVLAESEVIDEATVRLERALRLLGY